MVSRGQGGDVLGDSASEHTHAWLDEPVDILVVTVLPEEYGEIRAELANPRLDPGSEDRPNLYGWRLGRIETASGLPYRVAITLTGSAGNVNASQAVISSFDRWHPRYVVLAGIAGGLPLDDCALGDVVVSTEIYGYEYGKIEKAFHPRLNWTYQVDVALRNSAQTFAAARNWFRSDASYRPKVLFGAVASGREGGRRLGCVGVPRQPSDASGPSFRRSRWKGREQRALSSTCVPVANGWDSSWYGGYLGSAPFRIISRSSRKRGR